MIQGFEDELRDTEVNPWRNPLQSVELSNCGTQVQRM